MDDIRLLSEIHPQGRRNRHFSAVNQYQTWYRDIGISDFTTVPFLEGIAKIYADCQQQNKPLVLRDWAHIDFVGPPSTKPPQFKLTLDLTLGEIYTLDHVVVVRHPMETWRSLEKMSVIIDNNITATDFFQGYRRFLAEVSDFPKIRYEDFTANPAEQMEKLCGHLQVSYDADFQQKWSHYRNITGDMWNNSRASGDNTIRSFPIRPIPPALESLVNDSEDYAEILRLLNYPE